MELSFINSKFALFLLFLQQLLITFYLENSYVKMILRTLLQFTKNLLELQDICHRNFDLYCLPIRNDEMTTKCSGRLFLRFQNRLQELSEFLCDHKIARLPNIMELSKSMSYLILSCYLASHNSASSDKRHFLKAQGRSKRKTKKATKEDVELRAPKPFSFERLFNIYQALINLNERDDNVRRTLLADCSVQTQFAQLNKQSLVTVYGSYSISGSSKYNLSDVVTVKYIQEIASHVGLDIKSFIEGAS